MKKVTHTRRSTKVIPYPHAHRRAFPNAAEKRYFLNKALDWALAAATSLGTVTILMFLITMA